MADAPAQTLNFIVAMPTHDMVPAGFACDLGALMAHAGRYLPSDCDLGISVLQGTYVHSARNQLIDELIEKQATHILWLDTDMRFPQDTLARLFNHKKDVVGINYAKRGVPSGFVAIKQVGDDEQVGAKLETLDESTGLEEVEAVGFGVVLMRAKVLYKLDRSVPLFWFEWLPKRQQMIGEDVYFCKKLRETGTKIYVDHDLSKVCRHIGQYEYDIRSAQLGAQFKEEVGEILKNGKVPA